jgi:hypothetical protein
MLKVLRASKDFIIEFMRENFGHFVEQEFHQTVVRQRQD